MCSGEVKLSDFGIAKAVTYSSVFYRVRGKVGYMSPEMARNQPIDARSDLFSLGVSIYETIIGERIYTGDLNTPPDKIYAQAVPPLASKCPGLPAELQGVLDKALAIDPNARYADAESFAHALRQVAIAHRLLYSAPELAAELREIMGPDAEHWLTDKRDPLHARGAHAAPGHGGAPSDEANSLVEPGASISVGDDSDIENVATPPARPSGSLPTAASRSSAQLPAVTNRPPGPVAAAPSHSSEALAKAVPLPAPVAVPTPPPAGRPARSPFAFPRFHVPRPSGGVAAAPRSHRGFWLVALLVLAVLLGFAFVRFFLITPPPGGGRSGASHASAQASAPRFPRVAWPARVSASPPADDV